MSLDLATLTFAGGFVTFASGILVLGYWFQDRQAWAAFWWGLAAVGNGVGITLLALHGTAPYVIFEVAARCLLGLCAVLTWVAARVFNHRQVRSRLVTVVTGLWITVLETAGAHGAAWIIASLETGMCGCLYAAAALEFWRARAERLRARPWMVLALISYSIAISMTSAGYWTLERDPSVPETIHFVGLVYSVAAAVSLIMMLKERSELAYQAASLTDPLTGLANRRAFMDRAQRVFDRNLGEPAPVSLLVFDLDRFKLINDTFGHPLGDQVLRAFAEVLSWTLRPADIPARLGGEEFVVLLPDCGIEAAFTIADRIRVRFQGNCEFVNGHRVGATVSVGVSTSTSPAETLTDLIALADGALYDAKASGRNRVARAASPIPSVPSNVLKIA